MKESKAVTIITVFFIILGLISTYFSFFSTKFSFYKTELIINNDKIQEKLFYKPNKDYHILFRNFYTPISVTSGKVIYDDRTMKYLDNLKQQDNIFISKITCSDGKAYMRDSTLYSQTNCYQPPATSRFNCPAYAELNEYGCTFGYETGFKKGQEYKIFSIYFLQPKNLFKINEKYYIKFIAYSKNNHKLLIKNRNLIINGDAITRRYYMPNSDVIIYIPYTESDTKNYSIIYQTNFEFDDNLIQMLFIIILSFIPTILFLGTWYFAGKENLHVDLPPEMSFYPQDQERKGWEVASFFHPPFAIIDQEFFSSMLLDFYRKKIIDLNLKDKELYIKLTKRNTSDLDEVELEFIKLLEQISEKTSDKYRLNDYINLNKAITSYKVGPIIRLKLEDIQKLIKKESHRYIDSTSRYVVNTMVITGVILTYLIQVLSSTNLFVPILSFIIAAITFRIIYNKTAILTRYKKSYHAEYQHWQAFRKYLRGSPSMRESFPEAVILWEQYLVYASALGIAKEVLKKLKSHHLITEQQYQLYYITTTRTSPSFLTIGGNQGGGFGGAAGGGIGGGGGGGR